MKMSADNCYGIFQFYHVNLSFAELKSTAQICCFLRGQKSHHDSINQSQILNFSNRFIPFLEMDARLLLVGLLMVQGSETIFHAIHILFKLASLIEEMNRTPDIQLYYVLHFLNHKEPWLLTIGLRGFPHILESS